jgi:hypothetical protein
MVVRAEITPEEGDPARRWQATARRSMLISRHRHIKGLIPNHFQDETNSFVFWASGFVARSLQTAAGMRLARASPEAQNPARLSLILEAHWN